MADSVSVSSADFVRNVGFWLNEALHRRVSITHHGSERLVLAAPQDIKASAASEAAPVQEAPPDADRKFEKLEDSSDDGQRAASASISST